VKLIWLVAAAMFLGGCSDEGQLTRLEVIGVHTHEDQTAQGAWSNTSAYFTVRDADGRVWRVFAYAKGIKPGDSVLIDLDSSVVYPVGR
jgi:hypothetical protein